MWHHFPSLSAVSRTFQHSYYLHLRFHHILCTRSALATAPLIHYLNTHLANSLSFSHRLIEQPETTSISTHHLDQHTSHQSIHTHIRHYRPTTPKQSERKWHSCTRTAPYQPSRFPGSLALPNFARPQTSSGTVLSPSPYPCGRCNAPTPHQLPP